MDLEERMGGSLNSFLSSHEWHILFDRLPCGLFLVNRKGLIAAVNSKVQHMFGYAPHELLGKPIWIFMPVRQRKRYKQFLKEFFLSPGERSLSAGSDFWGSTKDGREILLKAGVNVLELQETILALIILVPASMKSHVEESCFQLEYEAVEHSKDHIAILNSQYQYQYVNWVYEEAHGLSRIDIVGKAVADILGKPVFDNVAKFYLDRCFSGERVVYQYGFHFKGRGFRQMEVTYLPLRSFQAGPIDRIMVRSKDITNSLEEEHVYQPIRGEQGRSFSAIEPSRGMPPKLRPTAQQAKVSPGWAKLTQLTPQKRTILAYVAQGKTNKEIAALMQISDKTVRNHLTSIFRKLRIRRRPEAASFFVRSVIEDDS